MLEAYSHNYVKSLLKKEVSKWPHNLTLSRLIGRSIRRHDRSIIELEVSDYNYCWLGILIPLSIHRKDVVLVVTEKQRHRLITFELPRLKKEGLNLACWEALTPPPGNQIWLLNHVDFLKVYRKGHLRFKQLLIPEAELFIARLREAMAINVTSRDWDVLRRTHPSASAAFIQLHEHITKELFSKVACIDGNVSMTFSEIAALQDLLGLLGESPQPWPALLNALSQKWASWAALNHKLLDWTWHLQPLEPLLDLQELFQESPFVMLFGSKENTLFLNQLESCVGSFDVNVRVGNCISNDQEPIHLFLPRRQPLPNTEYFADHLLDQSRRLILGRSGLTILLVDDDSLLRKLTTELAAEFGRRVIYQSTSPLSNGVICCSSMWWLTAQEKLPAPEQLIITILPFSTLESPLTAARVEAYKLQGLDWFRDLLLPELLTLLPKLVLPVRENQGRVAVLDGRLRSRSWGAKILSVLEPWNPLERLLPL